MLPLPKSSRGDLYYLRQHKKIKLSVTAEFRLRAKGAGTVCITYVKT